MLTPKELKRTANLSLAQARRAIKGVEQMDGLNAKRVRKALFGTSEFVGNLYERWCGETSPGIVELFIYVDEKSESLTEERLTAAKLNWVKGCRSTDKVSSRLTRNYTITFPPENEDK